MTPIANQAYWSAVEYTYFPGPIETPKDSEELSETSGNAGPMPVNPEKLARDIMKQWRKKWE